MKKLFVKTMLRSIALILVLSAIAQGAVAQSAQSAGSGKFGLGLMVGSPVGICFKYWLNEINALTGGISLGSGPVIQLNYLWHNFSAITPDEGRLPVHYGFGAQIYTGSERNNSTLGLRGVIGLTYIFDRAPVDMFLELAPLLEMGDHSELRLTASAGARFYF
ncbi:MAG: hypothetical protein A2297_00060 [Elusimicrobia bacterium RIFOXYB2_FULL_48_7]|nr:MAG: hypothetical protein A2297_00060 [Elusimicrobia bacterium RIFOXYB2_FULL_48_7]